MTHHKQVRIMSSDRQMFAAVDEGMAEIIQLLWELGIHTSYSCQSDIFDLAYILMPFRSARRLEKIIYAGIRRDDCSEQTREVFRRFADGQYVFEASIFRTRKLKNGNRKIRTLRQWRRATNLGQPYSVERTLSNAFGFRTTYRWPESATNEIRLALIEASQKIHGL